MIPPPNTFPESYLAVASTHGADSSISLASSVTLNIFLIVYDVLYMQRYLLLNHWVPVNYAIRFSDSVSLPAVFAIVSEPTSSASPALRQV